MAPTRSELIASSKCTNEESYLMQKLARAVVGTNNIDNCSRYCQSPATRAFSARLAMAAIPARSTILRSPRWF